MWWDGQKWGESPEKAPFVGNSSGAGKPAKKSNSLGCLSVIAVVVALIIGFQAWGNRPEAKQERELREAPVLAEIACERAIKNQLKSPSSAKFEGTSASRVGTTNNFAVAGNVDADNSFGASIRNTFICDVTVVNGSATVNSASTL